ncbi:MAG TPA: hypothetical protein VG148_14210 [Pyrinomonadaceae bacterium]|nr:hypothetical protein [Pyrinomonadaceae bacterium]
MRHLTSRVLTLLALAASACWVQAEARAQAADDCPRVVTEGGADARPDVVMTFRVAGLSEAQLMRLSFNWTVSAGVIAVGQGTPSVTVDLTGTLTTGSEVAVEIGGLKGKCDAVVSYTVPRVVGCRLPLDEYGDISFEDEKARLDNFAIELQNDPTAQGYVIAYGGRRARPGEARRRADRAKEYLAAVRGIDASRVVVVDGGFREDLTVVLWALPQGATPPQASPTVDPAEVEINWDAPAAQPPEE